MTFKVGDTVHSTLTGIVGIVTREGVTRVDLGCTIVQVKVRGERMTRPCNAADLQHVPFLRLCMAGDRVTVTDGQGRYAQAQIVHIHRKWEWASVDVDGHEYIFKAAHISQMKLAKDQS